MARKLLTIDEVAVRLGLDGQDVLAMIRAGRLRGTIVDGVMRVVERDADSFLREAVLSREHHGAAVPGTIVGLPDLAEEELVKFISAQYGVPAINLADYDVSADVIALVPKEAAVRLKVMPVQRAGGSLIVAMADPTNLAAIDEIKFLTGLNVEPVVATEDAIVEAIERTYGG